MKRKQHLGVVAKVASAKLGGRLDGATQGEKERAIAEASEFASQLDRVEKAMREFLTDSDVADRYGYTTLTIELSPQCRAAIEELHRSGFFGLTLTGVAEEMVRAGVRDAIVKGWTAMNPLIDTGDLRGVHAPVQRKSRKR